MATKAAKKTKSGISIDPAKILANIKSRAKKLESLGFQMSTIRTQLYMDVYSYVHFMVTNKRIESEDKAFESLTHATGKSKYTVNTWYYAGLFMATHKLSASSVSAKSVMNARCLEKSASPADFLKVLSAIRKNTHPGQVGDLITAARYKSGSESNKRVRKLKKNGKLTKSAMRMELMAVLTTMKSYFGDDIQVAVCSMDGELLLEVSD